MKKVALGVFGVVATVAVLALISNGPAAGSNFLAHNDEFDDVEQAYIQFQSKHHRSIHNKFEYLFRLSVFAKNYKLIEEYNQ